VFPVASVEICCLGLPLAAYKTEGCFQPLIWWMSILLGLITPAFCVLQDELPCAQDDLCCCLRQKSAGVVWELIPPESWAKRLVYVSYVFACLTKRAFVFFVS